MYVESNTYNVSVDTKIYISCAHLHTNQIVMHKLVSHCQTYQLSRVKNQTNLNIYTAFMDIHRYIYVP